jgi:serine/threonine protein kinase
VLISDQNTALLCDFGLSRIRHEITRARTDIRPSGRVAYVAPELLAGPDRYRTTEATDVYALAMTFLELGTLLPPFYPVANELRLINMIQSGHRPTAPTTLGKLPLQDFQTLWSMMQRMWASEGSIPGSATIYRSLLQLVTSLLLNDLCAK